MNRETLEVVAEKVLGDEDFFQVWKLLRLGRIDEAREQILEAVDDCYMDWYLSFLEAATFYVLVDPPLERFFCFPQRQVRSSQWE